MTRNPARGEHFDDAHDVGAQELHFVDADDLCVWLQVLEDLFRVLDGRGDELELAVAHHRIGVIAIVDLRLEHLHALLAVDRALDAPISSSVLPENIEPQITSTSRCPSGPDASGVELQKPRERARIGVGELVLAHLSQLHPAEVVDLRLRHFRAARLHLQWKTEKSRS